MEGKKRQGYEDVPRDIQQGEPAKQPMPVPPQAAPAPQVFQQGAINVPPQGQVAVDGGNGGGQPPGNPPNPPQPLINWLSHMMGGLYVKPKEAILVQPQNTDPFAGRPLEVAFISGSREGRPNEPVQQELAARVTAGGRPVPRVSVQFEVSHGDLGGGVTVVQRTTDGSGVARLGRWQLGEAPQQVITAEYRDVRDERRVRIRN